MSTDDMLAAQLWPWPDPIIKRNAQGGVIFVNAAFLQLYGGQVTDWHGCAVDGWPAPTTSQAASRFETRIPTAEGEHIFDWLEYVTADGGALAISRNITALLNHVPVPPQEPDLAAPVYAEDIPHTPQAAETAAPLTAPLTAPMAEPQTAAPDVNHAPHYDAPHHEDPVQDYVPEHVTEHVTEQPPVPAEPVLAAPAPDAVYDVAPLAPHVTEPTTVEMAAAPMAQAAEVEPERDFERRALPIEDDESLLGSNWRDAVIAKAVGADDMSAVSNAAPVDMPMEEVAAIAAPESALSAKPEAADNMPRILLAEDNAINALLTRTLLEADGCYVEVVEDGSLAVDAVKSKNYDMILMDMRMPNMDGLESTRKIRSLSNEAKAIPIIALTANAFDDDRNACFDAGMNDFMTKPVSAEELQQMVQTWTKTTSAAAA